MVNLHLEALDWIESLTLHACVVAVGCVLVFRGRITETALGAVVVISGLCIWTQHVAVFGSIVLMFVSSSVFTRLGTEKKSKLHNVRPEDAKRSWVQAICNLGPACAAVAVNAVVPNDYAEVAAFASIAAANADTWSSELGVLSRKQPRFILSRRVVHPGISGGVTAFGMLAACAGAVAIAGVYALTHADMFGTWCIALAGVAGSVFDSILGEKYQAGFRREGHASELFEHGNHLQKGYTWMTNDVVNGITTSSIAIASWCVCWISDTVI